MTIHIGGKERPSLRLIASQEPRPDTGHFTELHQTVIEIARLGRWMLFCDENHHGSCHTFPPWQTINPATSSMLIDLQKWCLMQITGQCISKYATLSYAWVEFLVLNHCSRRNLSIPGAMPARWWAISGGRTSNKGKNPCYRIIYQYYDEISRRIEIAHLGVYELWIKRKHGLTYRKEVGRI